MPQPFENYVSRVGGACSMPDLEDEETAKAAIIVHGIPKYFSKDQVEVFFESEKRCGGGDILNLELTKEGETYTATIVYENPKHAQRVFDCADDITFFDHQLKIERPSQRRTVDPRGIIVSQIPGNVSVGHLHVFFESKKRSGGGDIDDLQYTQGSGEAIIWFKDENIASRVIDRATSSAVILEGQNLNIKEKIIDNASVLHTKDDPDAAIRKVYMLKLCDCSASEAKIRQAVEQNVECLDDIGVITRNIKLFPEENVAVIEFFKPHHAQHLMKKGSIKVGDETSQVIPLDNSLEESGKFEGPQAICVTSLPQTMKPEMMRLFFKNPRKSGGDSIKKFAWYPEKCKAVITYDDSKIVRSIMAKHNTAQLTLGGVRLDITPMKRTPDIPPPLVTGPKDDNKLFILEAPLVSPEQLQEYFSMFVKTSSTDDVVLTEILYSYPPKKTILLTFSGIHSFLDIQLFTATYPLQDHMLTVQRIALPTWIQVHGILECREMVELYFQDPDSGGDVKLNLEDMDESQGWAILKCPDHEVVRCLTQREHIINGTKVHTDVYYPEFGLVPLRYDAKKPWKDHDKIHSSKGAPIPARIENVDDPDQRCRTVIVKGVTDISPDVLELFFQSKRKTGGGDIREYHVEGDEARIVFEDQEVASRVLSRSGDLVLEWKTLTVEEPPKAPQVDPLSVLVQKLPAGITEDGLELFFESKKKSGGGEVENIEFDEDNCEAVVTFKEEEVAQRVLSMTDLTLNGANLVNTPVLKNVQDVSVTEPVDPRVVIVEGISPKTNTEILQMFFEAKRKTNGGEIVDLDFDKEARVAKITFEEAEVAQRVLSQSDLTLEGAKLVVHAPVSKNVPDVRPKSRAQKKPSGRGREDKSQIYLPDELQNVTTVLISCKTATEKDLRTVLESRRESGGGEVRYIDMYPEREAAVVRFKHAQDAQGVLQQGSIHIGKDQCRVLPLDTSLEDSGLYPGPFAICVTGLNPKTDKDMIELFFVNRKKSGGKDIDTLYWNPEKGTAVITFGESDTVNRVIAKHASKPLKLKDADLSISKMMPAIPPKLIVGPKEPKKLFIVNAPNVKPKELRQYFDDGLIVANSVKSVLKEILFSLEEKKTILIEFDDMPGYNDIQLLCATRPLMDHMLTVQRVALPTHVQVHNVTASEEMVEFYFQDPKYGGDNDVSVEDMDGKNKWAILECPSPAVVKSLTQKTHKVGGSMVHVSTYYPEFGLIPYGYDPKKPWDFRPGTYVHPF